MNPYRTAKMMMGAFERAGIQRQRTRRAEAYEVTIIVLKRPSRSAIQPGIVRPKMEAALRMETR